MKSDHGIICVTGMHCSGTSATARIVNLLGVDFGRSDRLTETYRSNTKGLWEHPGMRTVAQRLLKTLGGSWDEPPPLEPGWHRSDLLDAHRAEARHVARTAFGDSTLWGWKDPRASLLLPFWEDVLGPVRVVACVRSPNDVIATLSSWDGMDRARGCALWERYTRGLVEIVETREAIVSPYESLLGGGEAYSRLAEFVGRPGADEQPEFQHAADEWIDRSMWNHRAGADERASLDGLPSSVRDLYQRLVARVA